MSKIEDLIRQYCPDGVEYKTLKDVCSDIIVPMRDRPKVFDGDVPWCRIEDKEGHLFNGSLSGLGVSDVVIKQMNLKVFPIGTVICSCSASLGAYAINTKPIITNQTFIGLVCGETILNWYLLYFMETQTKHLISLASTGTIPYISRKKFEDLEIPLPPLPVQEAIVNILDRFTVYAAELQAELQARQQQYNYYRDTLLSFEGREDVQWKKLGEVGTEWYRGAGIKRDEVSDEGTPCIRYGEIHTTYNIWFDECLSHTDESKQPAKKYADHGDILFAITSEDIPFVGNSVAYLGKERIMVGGDIVVMKHDQDPKYMSYILSTSNAVMQKGKGKVKSKVVHTNVPSLQEIVVPIPSLEEQRRIADILDNFHTLTNDLSQGLPAEIEARQQQYEYYRDQLLTFKRKEA